MTPHDLFLLAKKKLRKSKHLTLQDLTSDTATAIIEGLENDEEIGEGRFRYNFDSISRIFSAYIPTWLHDSVQIAVGDILKDMHETGFLTWSQFKALQLYSGARHEQFVGAYTGSKKEPDTGVLVKNRTLNGIPTECPLWINETAYSDSKPKLQQDIRKWMDGTAGAVVWGIAPKFYKRINARIAGTIDFHRGPSVISKSIFPPPQNPIDDEVSYTRGELFDNSLPLEPDQTSQDVYVVNVKIFREYATWAARRMGLTPV